jgi:hypothetical protein
MFVNEETGWLKESVNKAGRGDSVAWITKLAAKLLVLDFALCSSGNGSARTVVETARQWIAMNDSRIVVLGRYDNRDPKQARPAAGNVGALSLHGGTRSVRES